MCIYCGTIKYRKIYENHYGPIPKDSDGRSYEVHHIDGNHKNNDPINLKCVSIQEHYDIHYSQGDWAACVKMANRINLSAQELSALASKNANQMVTTGKHPWVGSNKHQAQLNKDRVQNGTHNFLGGKQQRDLAISRIENGTHHFVNNPLKEENHPHYDHTVRTWRNRSTGEVVQMTTHTLRTTYNLKSGAVSRVVNNKGLKATGGWELVQ